MINRIFFASPHLKMKDGLLNEKDDEEPDGHDQLGPGIVHVHLVLFLNLVQHLATQVSHYFSSDLHLTD